jgi:hypothetical protein
LDGRALQTYDVGSAGGGEGQKDQEGTDDVPPAWPNQVEVPEVPRDDERSLKQKKNCHNPKRYERIQESVVVVGY